mgnify:CR=1 FL=1
MDKKKILVVEDEKAISDILVFNLQREGYDTLAAYDGAEGLRCALEEAPDLILLDLGLPDIDGMEVLRQVRQKSEVPIIIVSARGQEREKVSALDEGADDFVMKPFNAEELLARIRVALRHKGTVKKQMSEFELDSLKIDFEKRKIFVHGQEIHLTPIEYKMMTLLVNNSGKVLTHHYIQNQVWGYDTTDDYQSLRVFMANIRRKIEDDTANPRFILTEVGVGYRFADE